MGTEDSCLMNINEYVWVRLTDAGYERHTPYSWDEAGNGWYRFQLWDLMAIFGRHLHIGSTPLFEDNEIHLAKPPDAER